MVEMSGNRATPEFVLKLYPVFSAIKYILYKTREMNAPNLFSAIHFLKLWLMAKVFGSFVAFLTATIFLLVIARARRACAILVSCAKSTLKPGCM